MLGIRIFGPEATRGHDIRESHPSYGIQNMIWGQFFTAVFRKASVMPQKRCIAPVKSSGLPATKNPMTDETDLTLLDALSTDLPPHLRNHHVLQLAQYGLERNLRTRSWDAMHYTIPIYLCSDHLFVIDMPVPD